MPNSCAANRLFVQGPLAPIPEKTILPDMLRLFRKWRLIRRLHKECLRHIIKQGNGWVLMQNQVRVVKGVFAQETAARFPWKKWWGPAAAGSRRGFEKYLQQPGLVED